MKAKRRIKIAFIILTIFLSIWMITGLFLATFKKSDNKTRAEFKKLGLDVKCNTLVINSQHLHYVQTGADSLPTLLFIHGSPGSWDGFEAYLKDRELVSTYRMIAIDRPGFGGSDYGAVMPMEKQVDLMSNLIQGLQNNRPLYLIGHSLGGPIIVWLAAQNPKMVSGLVILAGSVDPAEEAPETWRRILNNPVLSLLLPGAFKQSNNELVNFKKEVFDLQSKFKNVTCKAVIVHGTKDTFVPPGNATFAKNKLVNATSVETILIVGANHFIPWEHYTEIKGVLLKL